MYARSRSADVTTFIAVPVAKTVAITETVPLEPPAHHAISSAIEAIRGMPCRSVIAAIERGEAVGGSRCVWAIAGIRRVIPDGHARHADPHTDDSSVGGCRARESRAAEHRGAQCNL